jgi:hypothetical protein
VVFWGGPFSCRRGYLINVAGRRPPTKQNHDEQNYKEKGDSHSHRLAGEAPGIAGPHDLVADHLAQALGLKGGYRRVVSWLERAGQTVAHL